MFLVYEMRDVANPALVKTQAIYIMGLFCSMTLPDPETDLGFAIGKNKSPWTSGPLALGTSGSCGHTESFTMDGVDFPIGTTVGPVTRI